MNAIGCDENYCPFPCPHHVTGYRVTNRLGRTEVFADIYDAMEAAARWGYGARVQEVSL
jgi:hypothetical protein